jgi:hypothetical protein
LLAVLLLFICRGLLLLLLLLLGALLDGWGLAAGRLWGLA